MNDFAILGIKETGDQAAIKVAYRKRLKELHPDTSPDADKLKNHFLLIEVCKAYQRLKVLDREWSEKSRRIGEKSIGRSAGSAGARAADTGTADTGTADTGTADTGTANTGTADTGTANTGTADTGTPGTGRSSGVAIVRHKDQAYVFYKRGVTAFAKIHPSQWNIDTSSMLNIKIPGDDDEQAVIKMKVLDLVKLFPTAYYYFSIVAHDYPESPWAEDAKDKMGLIENRTRLYKHIIDSFRSWNEVDAEVKGVHEKIFRRSQAIKASLSAADRRVWRHRSDETTTERD